ncbi:MAG: hypothetical protein M1836_000762 [Candelina mexicana]|nr:MAG: hypothetical protein M1836_000762 [Candelina mexicana]
MRVNARASPLLNLPPELRNYIYELVLGGRLVHILGESSFFQQKFDHCVCDNEVSEQAIYEESMEMIEDCPYTSRVDSCDERHEGCHEDFYEELGRIDPTILLTCRQVYQEARFIPFATNTFSFNEADHLSQFLSKLFPVQRNAIHGIHIDYILEENASFKPWNDFFTVENVKSLKGLRRLHLCIEQRFHCEVEFYRHMREDAYQDVFFQGFLKLQRLPLETVTVVMTDNEFGKYEDEYRAWKLADMALHDDETHNDDAESKELWAVYERLQEQYRWTAADKRKFSEDMKARLLEPWDQAEFNRVRAEEAAERKKQDAARAEWRALTFLPREQVAAVVAQQSASAP